MATLERNDPDAAVQVYKRGLLSGTWTLDYSRRLLAMQDNPDALLALIADANKDPKVAAALQKLLDADAISRS